MACGGSARYLLALIAYLATIATLTDGKIFTSLKLKDNTIILRANSGPLRDQINHLTARFRRDDATPAKKNNNNSYNNNNNITTSTMAVTSQPTATTTTEHRQRQENTNNNGENKNSDSNGPLESPDLSVPTPAAAASQTLITSFVNLPDWNHNEAIVHWSGNKSNVIFVLTRDHDPSGDVSDSTLWQSKDYGGTFQRINFTDEALIYYYFTSNVNHNKLIFTDVKNKQLFLTYNEAEQMIQVPIGFVPSRILMHPVQEDWVLGYDLKAGKLYSSLNFGLNWTLLHEHVTPRFFWAIDGQDKSPATVHMELLDTIGQSLYLACLAPHCDIVTMDHSINPILPSSLVVQDEYVFVQKQHAESNKLYVSYQRGKFKMSHFPQNLHPQNFNILNTDEGQVFVAVHYKKDYINCYLSDPSGQFFVLTLENIVAVTLKGHFQVDLYQVKGLPGVYLANQEPKDMQLKESGRRTFISFDKGGNWSLIPVPKNLKSQCAADKKKECSLHLHLQQIETFFNVPRVLSDENAPGLILAHGTIGTGLSFRGVGVFITQDAGLTWYAAPFHGLHELNILDQGSAITALNASWKTREIYFTCNEGRDWQKHIFAKEDVYVDGVLNEPGINTLIVSIYAHKFPSKGWILIKANFSSILTRHCTSDDYESWTPVKHTINGCILGRKLTYERKKQFSECNNGRDYERPINITICQCTAEDFECDFGYEQKNGEDCQPAQWFDVNRPVFECPENQHFNKSRGYRKVGGDYCIGGVSSQKKYHHVLTKCPVIAPDGLQLLTAKPVVATQSVIKFNLIQATGSVLTTNYTIDFGDGTIKYYSGPSVLSNQLSHMYTHHGTFTVIATARNENGSSTATYVVHAEDEIEKFSVESLYGAQVQHPAIFNTDVRGHHLTASNIGNVHYVWHFGDEDFRLPLLTWEKNVSHVYTQPGTYIATIEAINSVSSAYVQIPIKVYSYIKRIQVTFSSNVDTINENNLEWRSWLKTQLQEKVADFLRINENRLIVFVHNDLPPKADVTLLPHDPLMVADENTDQLVEKLISSVKQEKLKIQWLDYTIKVTGASVKEERNNKRSRRNMLPIIIAAPVLALSLVIVIFVFLYYRRKFHHVQRYSFLQARDAADSLLEDDDDDPPLDPNPNFSHIEMTGEQTDAVGGGGLVDPVLVMMPGGLSQSNLTDPHALRC